MAQYVFLIFAMFIVQLVGLGLLPICSSTIFTIEYGFDATQIGLTNLGGIVGIVLATMITGPLMVSNFNSVEVLFNWLV